MPAGLEYRMVPSGAIRSTASKLFSMTALNRAWWPFWSSTSVQAPTHRTAAPVSFRWASARARNQRYAPSWRRSRYSVSNGLPVATARDQASQVGARSSGWSIRSQPSPRVTPVGRPEYSRMRRLW